MRCISASIIVSVFLCLMAVSSGLSVVAEEGSSAELMAGSVADTAEAMALELGFGKAMLKHFTLDKTYINLNHGGQSMSRMICSQKDCKSSHAISAAPEPLLQGISEKLTRSWHDI